MLGYRCTWLRSTSKLKTVSQFLAALLVIFAKAAWAHPMWGHDRGLNQEPLSCAELVRAEHSEALVRADVVPSFDHRDETSLTQRMWNQVSQGRVRNYQELVLASGFPSHQRWLKLPDHLIPHADTHFALARKARYPSHFRMGFFPAHLGDSNQLPKAAYVAVGGLNYSLEKFAKERAQWIRTMNDAQFDVFYVELLGQGLTGILQALEVGSLPLTISYEDQLEVLRRALTAVSADLMKRFGDAAPPIHLDALSYGGWVSLAAIRDPRTSLLLDRVILREPGLKSLIPLVDEQKNWAPVATLKGWQELWWGVDDGDFDSTAWGLEWWGLIERGWLAHLKGMEDYWLRHAMNARSLKAHPHLDKNPVILDLNNALFAGIKAYDSFNDRRPIPPHTQVMMLAGANDQVFQGAVIHQALASILQNYHGDQLKLAIIKNGVHDSWADPRVAELTTQYLQGSIPQTARWVEFDPEPQTIKIMR